MGCVCADNKTGSWASVPVFAFETLPATKEKERKQPGKRAPKPVFENDKRDHPASTEPPRSALRRKACSRSGGFAHVCFRQGTLHHPLSDCQLAGQVLSGPGRSGEARSQVKPRREKSAGKGQQNSTSQRSTSEVSPRLRAVGSGHGQLCV